MIVYYTGKSLIEGLAMRFGNVDTRTMISADWLPTDMVSLVLGATYRKSCCHSYTSQTIVRLHPYCWDSSGSRVQTNEKIFVSHRYER